MKKKLRQKICLQKFSEVRKFGYFPKVMWKTVFFALRTHLIHQPLASNATSCTMLQLAMLPNITVVIWVTIMSTLDMFHTIGYCLYGTLLLCPRWTACPVQIRAHHHRDVYTDINERIYRYCKICHLYFTTAYPTKFL